MKKLSFWFISMFILMLGFTSCEQTEEFDNEPQVEIVVDNKEGSAVYSFEAKTSGMEGAELIWTVNGNVIDGDNQNDIINQILDYLFESGTHTICVKLIKGDLVREACVEIDVEVDENDPCPDLFFKARQYEEPNTYKFFADFRGIEEIGYGWYINGELVEDSSPDERNYFIYDFKEPGVYEVCIKAETPDCPEGASYCKEIVVEEVNSACPEVAFEKELEAGSDSVYIFEAIIEGADNVTEIHWFVNDDLVENATDQQGGNRILRYQFEQGVYKVCIQVITPDCPEGVKYCKEIRIEGDCPNTAFRVEEGNGEGLYTFISSVERDDVLFYWYINGQLVGDAGSNYFEYDFLLDQSGNLPGGPGDYEICLQIEAPNCPIGNSEEFCKIITVKEANQCPELSFELEQDGDNPAYYFYPGNFEGVEDVSSEWFVNGDYVGSSTGMQDPFYYQFNPGTYEICLMIETPDCPNGVKLCQEIMIPE
ncbi:hypothetical protein U6A24_16380 [Aquimarina gracilis]|uniref:PKD domain-containing protein n=1 Tax=Aquimarina gracilis TaxID=874422 RepID=A0ABU5ZYX5_9FLAO|nr:hypothetical protein [Aquimarina gracilis]MEB3347051.1 hypothetical protein [Aquimarina gracilis]